MQIHPAGNLRLMPKKRFITAEDLLKIQYVGDPRISPDGSRILFSKKHVGDKNQYITNLFTVDLDGNVRQWTQGDGGDAGGRWSPDGSRIAFTSGRDKPASQIFVIPTDGGEARALTKFPEGSVGALRWSPDGKWIACTFRKTHESWTETAKKEREEKGLSTPPWELDDIWYRLDGDGYFGGQRYAIYLVNAETGEHRELYRPGPLGTCSFDWSPDSTRLAVTHTANKRPMAEPDNDQIFILDLKGKATRLQGLPKGTKSSIRWSPDGKWLAYAGDVDENDPWGVRNTRLYVVPSEGGEPRCLTDVADFCLTAATLSDTKEAGFEATAEWAPDSQALYVQIGWHGEQQLAIVPLDRGGVEMLTKGHHLVTVGNVSTDGSKIACLWGNATTLNEVAVYDLDKHPAKPKTLTGFNSDLHAALELSEPEEVWLASTDETKVHAWVMLPPRSASRSRGAAHRWPAVLEIHGGPHAQYGWAFFHEFQLLAAQGYVVVYSNPRGSKGYGEKFCAAIRGDWGNKDWDDVQAVIKFMERHPAIDSQRMGVMGGSYGGYMTNWVVGHSKAFKAAITDRCVSNMVSMAGNSDFPFNKNAYFKGVPWGSLEEIAELWRQSPIAYFKDVRTPMLIIHSEGDLRCNIEQSEQVFTALQQEGVESRFVRYPRETSHGMSRQGPPDLRLHRLAEILAWWKRHL